MLDFCKITKKRLKRYPRLGTPYVRGALPYVIFRRSTGRANRPDEPSIFLFLFVMYFAVVAVRVQWS